jgi:centrosomal protein CEP76
MDAYVTMGLDNNNNAHVWVTTIDINQKAVFWESVTSVEYPQSDEHYFKSIGCCFNNDCFYGNIQYNDNCRKVSFDFNDKSKWKVMKKKEKEKAYNNITVFDYFVKNVGERERELESYLKIYVNNFRNESSLTTLYDNEMSHLMGMAISYSESSKLFDKSTLASNFQHVIKRMIPDGHTFRVGFI